MTFPTTDSIGRNLVPTARSFESGDFPVKTFKAQNGKETRILYGSNRTNMRLSLTYSNIPDADAELFLDHFHEVQGTFQTFGLGTADAARGGWEAIRMHLERRHTATTTGMRSHQQLHRCDLGLALLQ